jgi:hypothetical protein
MYLKASQVKIYETSGTRLFIKEDPIKKHKLFN